MCSRLTFLDVHPALSILRSSLSSPKFQYLSGFLHDNQLLEVYCFFRSTLESIANNKMTEICQRVAASVTFSSFGSTFGTNSCSTALSNKVCEPYQCICGELVTDIACHVRSQKGSTQEIPQSIKSLR